MDSRRALTVLVTAVAVVGAAVPSAAVAKHPAKAPVVEELAHFAAPGCGERCGSGSTVGPDGALYVTDGVAGRVLRVDPWTGDVSTFASGLPARAVPDVGGAMDVAFLHGTAYVLVTVVGPGVGQPVTVVNGIHRVNPDGSTEPVVDLGTWSIENPPATDFFVPGGVQYAMDAFRGGFLVTDGHHNRVLRVNRHGGIRELMAFGNIVPTGLEIIGRHIFMGQAGPIPHLPEDGKVVHFTPRSAATEVASGEPLIVDVELGPHWRLYALSQGIWDLPVTPENEGQPASADTGKLLRIDHHGGFSTVVEGLDRPTSLEFIGDSAFVVTITGKILRIDDVGRWHGGKPH